MLPRRTAAALAVAVLATACTPAEEPEEANDAVQQAVVDEDTALRDQAAPYVGMEVEAALTFAAERDVVARIGTMADVGQPGQTADYEVGRLTFVVVDGVVAEVIVELEQGPITVAAS